MYRISQVLQNLHRESILDLEEECRKNGDFRTIQLLETEIDSPLYEPDVCDGFIDELIAEVLE